MTTKKKYLLFIDLDGVLVDFDAGVKDVCGKKPEDLQPRTMWPRLVKSPDFYNRLGWIPDGKDLWTFVSKHSPIILTGLPMGNWAEGQKRTWCARELGKNVEVITCMSRQKAATARQRSGELIPVLVDDRIKLQEDWDDMGGIFIHHKTATSSINELKKLGF